jgi:hypothetical protein
MRVQIVSPQLAILPRHIPIGYGVYRIDVTKFDHEYDLGFIAFVGEVRCWVKTIT